MGSLYEQAKAHLPPPSPKVLLQRYEGFVSQNASSVGQIESALRSLSYIIPGRFKESELATESLHASVQLLSMYHDSLLARVFAKLPPSIPRPTPSPHNRYTKFWAAKSVLYRRISIFLQTIQYTELLWEMAAKRKGDKVRWRVVVFLEVVKALCKLVLMRLTEARPTISPPLAEREPDPRAAQQEESGAADESRWDGMETPPLSEASSDMSWTMPRTGLSLPNIPDSTEITDYLLKRVLTADDIKAPKQLLHRITTYRGQLAEIAWIFRPVVYALLMQRYQRDKKNWTPWIVGICMEYAARQLAKKDLSQRIIGGLRGLTSLERDELKKRGFSLAWWMMRGAFYEHITRIYIRKLTQKLKGKPMLDLLGGVVEEYDYLWNEYYFSTASS